MKNIVLIGFMGTGKTAVGKRLANRLNREFVDTDFNIEEITGKSISEIFRKDGETRFRSEEKLQVKKLAGREGLVISTGGGIVMDSENIELLKKNGVLICLTADPEVIYSRVKNKKRRPLLQTKDVRKEVYRLMKEREDAYNVADFKVDTGEGSVNDTVERIINFLKEKGYINEDN